MERTLLSTIQKDLKRKIILITGPRQTGKTTLTKMINPSFDYLNFDLAEHRLRLHEKSWDRKKSVVIFDELHKMKKWKSWLKGIFDTEGLSPALVVTGSAKLDLTKKMGDSLAGRFFEFRLHPLDLKEIKSELPTLQMDEAFKRLLTMGGFPEPFLENSLEFYGRWKHSHLDIIVKQDLIEIENIRQITSIETLIQLLRKQVGSTISYRSLANDLQTSDKTVKRWLDVLERSYIVFKVVPHHRNVARAILKSPKYYFYDTGQVLGNEGQKLENLTACALIKEIHYRQDVLGQEYTLRFIRDKENREIDFVILKNEKVHCFIETKWADEHPSPYLSYWEKELPEVQKIQLVGQLTQEKTYSKKLEIRKASHWLSKMEF